MLLGAFQRYIGRKEERPPASASHLMPTYQLKLLISEYSAHA